MVQNKCDHSNEQHSLLNRLLMGEIVNHELKLRCLLSGPHITVWVVYRQQDMVSAMFKQASADKLVTYCILIYTHLTIFNCSSKWGIS